MKTAAILKLHLGFCALKDPNCLSYNSCWSDDCYCEETGGGFFSKLGDEDRFWSSYVPSGYSGYAWLVYFHNGAVNEYRTTDYKAIVRCVG